MCDVMMTKEEYQHIAHAPAAAAAAAAHSTCADLAKWDLFAASVQTHALTGVKRKIPTRE
jgi:hypothetical protein